MRADGSAEHILEDKYLGWHAGNWEVNCRSVAICVDDDLADKEPSGVVLAALATIIRQHYGQVLPEKIVGHCDVNPHRVCPGALWPEWRKKVLASL
ncbi:MAG TPA: N-acetylmuramoyl-L-alanine amidase [Candidatus Acidoferrum sp.]|nr:N-acetylmuramoyl-L-alanine amidase [Candidatus Acidoferrum sp.]